MLCSTFVAAEYQKTSDATEKNVENNEDNKPPEGYYAFIESPNAEPPKVRPPPYEDVNKECQGKRFFAI